MTTLVVVFLLGMAAGVIITLVTACVVAFGNDNEYLDYPPEEMDGYRIEDDRRYRYEDDIYY